jgi:hypothetical protein
MPMRVESTPALLVSRTLQHGFHGRLQMLKEDQILRPGSTAFVAFIERASLSRLQYSLAVGHVVVHPASWIHVEYVCFVQVARPILTCNVDGRLAGQRPGIDLGVDKVASPGCAVTWHEKSAVSSASHQ